MKKNIYLAGGCFWGLEAYMKKIDGIISTKVGYANGNTENPTYHDVCHDNTGHAETVEIGYDESVIDLRKILKYYFRVIDPTALNRQGNDVGNQYRTGIYYENEEDKEIIKEELLILQENYEKKIVVEVEPLNKFYEAEEYHQDYLTKNPSGYCHIDISLAEEPIIDDKKYQKPSKIELEKNLTKEEYEITQLSHTERPFSSKYWDSMKKGIYVDIATGEPLFSSKDKFVSQCGWPSFSKPIASEVVLYEEDNTLGMKRIEVKSRVGDSHLGHVFEDGPIEAGGLRYCINGRATRFIALEKMEEEGYGDLIKYV